VVTCDNAEVARFRPVFTARTEERSEPEEVRIQPTRSPPQSSLDTDPTASTSGLSAASGAGANAAERHRSASVRSSITVTRPASATAAMPCRHSGGITEPHGLCPVGITYPTDPAGARANSRMSDGADTVTTRPEPNVLTSPGYSGQLAIARPGRSTRPSSHNASWAPAVTMICSADVGNCWNDVK
jgi:hypothetical protein